MGALIVGMYMQKYIVMPVYVFAIQLLYAIRCSRHELGIWPQAWYGSGAACGTINWTTWAEVAYKATRDAQY